MLCSQLNYIYLYITQNNDGRDLQYCSNHPMKYIFITYILYIPYINIESILLLYIKD